VLRDIGGWDAFNVTEDADIGIRLSQLGYRVAMLDSTTFEEAPIAVGAWLRQRSRWLKGYMQTWLVHMRDPVALVRRTGLSGFLAFQLFIGGGVIFALANPPLWLALGIMLLMDGGSGAAIPGIGLLTSNVLLTYLAVLAPRRRGWDALAPYGLTVIAYWGLVSAAGYRGAWQLITKPFFWEKTMHGIVPPKPH
jgi:cellulose synthase/poly-beta-1,6-N-acetylglucosamine synthase-like glycosyltransferase